MRLLCDFCAFRSYKMATGGSDPSAIQLQLRRNAEELKDYLQDLGQWEDEIKKKEEYIIKQKPILKKSVPPVRGQQPVVKKKKTAVKEGGGQKGDVSMGRMAQPQRIRSYDYKSWDKYDVRLIAVLAESSRKSRMKAPEPLSTDFDTEKACSTVDEVSGEGSTSEEEEEEEEGEKEEEEAIEEQRRRQRALLEKEKGNDLFREGKFEAAIEHYSSGMALDPRNAMLPANRAMALIKVERYAAAEVDCSLALSLDATYSKALFRRGLARAHLGRGAEAVEDFKKVLELDPGNKQAEKELQKWKKKLAKEEKVGTISKKKDSPEVGQRVDPHVRPVVRPAHQRSKKPLRRIAIEEIGGETAGVGVSPSPHAPEGPSGALTSGGQREESHIVEAVSLSEATGKGSGGVEEMKNKAAFSPEGASAAQSGPGLSLHPAPDAVETTASPTPVSLAGVTTPDTARGVTVEVEPLPPVPSTSLQFVADWKELRGQEGRMLAYFQQLPVACYPIVLQQSLETDVFPTILKLLRDHYIQQGRSCLQELRSLTQVQRFSVGVMFLSLGDKKVLQDIFTGLESLCPDKVEEINSLRKCYRT